MSGLLMDGRFGEGGGGLDVGEGGEEMSFLSNDFSLFSGPSPRNSSTSQGFLVDDPAPVVPTPTHNNSDEDMGRFRNMNWIGNIPLGLVDEKRLPDAAASLLNDDVALTGSKDNSTQAYSSNSGLNDQGGQDQGGAVEIDPNLVKITDDANRYEKQPQGTTVKDFLLAESSSSSTASLDHQENKQQQQQQQQLLPQQPQQQSSAQGTIVVQQPPKKRLKRSAGVLSASAAVTDTASEKSEKARNPWTKEEDNKIVELVRIHGVEKGWKFICSAMPGRTAKQCSERWRNHLDPNVKKHVWTEVEDSILIRTHRVMGPKWSTMAKLLPGRTDHAIKNRWYSTMRRVNRQYRSRKISPRDMKQILFRYCLNCLASGASTQARSIQPASKRRNLNMTTAHTDAKWQNTIHPQGVKQQQFFGIQNNTVPMMRIIPQNYYPQPQQMPVSPDLAKSPISESTISSPTSPFAGLINFASVPHIPDLYLGTAPPGTPSFTQPPPIHHTPNVTQQPQPQPKPHQHLNLNLSLKQQQQQLAAFNASASTSRQCWRCGNYVAQKAESMSWETKMKSRSEIAAEFQSMVGRKILYHPYPIHCEIFSNNTDHRLEKVSRMYFECHSGIIPYGVCSQVVSGGVTQSSSQGNSTGSTNINTHNSEYKTIANFTSINNVEELVSACTFRFHEDGNNSCIEIILFGCDSRKSPSYGSLLLSMVQMLAAKFQVATMLVCCTAYSMNFWKSVGFQQGNALAALWMDKLKKLTGTFLLEMNVIFNMESHYKKIAGGLLKLPPTSVGKDPNDTDLHAIPNILYWIQQARKDTGPVLCGRCAALR